MDIVYGISFTRQGLDTTYEGEYEKKGMYSVIVSISDHIYRIYRDATDLPDMTMKIFAIGKH